MAKVVDQVVDQKEWGGAVGSAGNDELEVKTYENHHPHPTSRCEKKKVVHGMSLRCEICCVKWSGDTPQG